MIDEPEWTWDAGTRVGFLHLHDSDISGISTEEHQFPNVTILIDLDSQGNAVGIEVLK